MHVELVCPAVVDGDRDEDADDEECSSPTSGQGLVEGLELVEESADGEEHGQVIACPLSISADDCVISNIEYDPDLPIWLW